MADRMKRQKAVKPKGFYHSLGEASWQDDESKKGKVKKNSTNKSKATKVSSKDRESNQIENEPHKPEGMGLAIPHKVGEIKGMPKHIYEKYASGELNTKITQEGKKIKFIVVGNEGKKLNIHDVNDYIDWLSWKWKQEGKDRDIRIAIGGGGDGGKVHWISTKTFRSGQHANIGSFVDGDADYGYVIEDLRYVDIYFNDISNHTGGDSENGHNDCLYYILKEQLQKFPFQFKTPESFKYFLGLKREDPVPISLLPKIEQTVDAKIVVLGDASYQSSYTPKQQILIPLKLKDGHFTLRTRFNSKDDQYMWRPKKASYNSRQLAIVQKKDGKIFYTIGDITKEMDKQTYYNHKDNPVTSPFVFNDFDTSKVADPLNGKDPDNNDKKKPKYESPSDQYYKTKEIWDEAYKMSKGKINMYRFGYPSIASVHLWRETVPSYNPEPIGQLEAEWLMKAKNGGLMYAREGTGFGWEYDFVQAYTSIMKDPYFRIPLKAGKFETLPENYFDDPLNGKVFVSYGIYRCTIETDAPFFKFHPEEYYTFHDLKTVRDFGGTIRLKQDGQPNALLYREGMVCGNRIFKPYIDWMTKLRQKGCRLSKLLLNCLWGALGETKTFPKTVNHE